MIKIFLYGWLIIKETGQFMRTINEIMEYDKFTLNEYKPGIGGWGFLFLTGEKYPATVTFSMGETGADEGWEHVSINLKKRYPTWIEMCILKDIFFKEDECVVQFFPAKSKNEDIPNCLHLWRNKNFESSFCPQSFV